MNVPTAIGDESVKSRIQWIDGLKGIAAFMVFTHHFLLLFLPASYYGADAESLLPGGIDALIPKNPLSVLINGNFWVYLFCTIMAFFFATKMLKTEEDKLLETIPKTVAKRYVRLLIPCLLSGLLFFFGARLLTLLHLNYSGVMHEIGVLQLFYRLFVRMWVLPEYEVIGQFWTMWILFLGAFIAMFLALSVRKAKTGLGLAILGFSGVFFIVLKPDLFCIVLGTLLALYMQNRKEQAKRPWLRVLLSLVSLLLGLYLGSYPTYGDPGPLYFFHVLTDRFFREGPWIVYHGFGAFFLLLGIIGLSGVRKFLSRGVFRFLGAQAFSVYVLHYMLIRFIGYYLKDRLQAAPLPYLLVLIITYLALSALILLGSAGFTALCERLTKRILRLLRLS